ncbi:hypothetical protein [Falsibacillus pallidus]|uniref:hypothetical protein n=1 Tax=Falsibacillus pallidus TaxID=493781 RepID=UPI003D9523EA
MKVLGMVGGLLGIVLSLFCMLFAIVDDSYTFGNIGLLGVLAGIIAVIVSFRNRRSSGIWLLVTAGMGIIGLAIFYTLPAVLQVIAGVVMIKRDGK